MCRCVRVCARVCVRVMTSDQESRHLAFVHGLLQRYELAGQPAAGPSALAHAELARLLAPRLEALDLLLRGDRAAAAGGGGGEVVAQLRRRAAVLLDDAHAWPVGVVLVLPGGGGVGRGGGGLVGPCEALDLDRGVALGVGLVLALFGLERGVAGSCR